MFFKSINKQLLVCLLLSFTSTLLLSQDTPRSHPFLAVGINYGLDLPAADLADRYESSFHAGLSLNKYSLKLKGFFGIEGNFQFGNNVKEDVLAPFRLESGAILGNNGAPADLFLRRRGLYVGAIINKTLLSSKNNPYAGLTLGLGIGILQHNIRLLNDSNNANQVSGDYAKGYDRNTRGLATKQTLTYQHIGTNRSLNYSIGLSLTEGFTSSVRKVNFDTGLPADGRRLDMILSLEATWYLPIRESASPEEIFY